VERIVQKVILFQLTIASKALFALFLAHCSQPKASGSCRASLQRFYYNSATKTCELFTYGGCQGNENNFKTKAQCETTCKA